MDSSHKFFFSCLMITFLLPFTIAQQQPLFHFCRYERGNFTRNSTYETNLNNVLSSFSSITANDNGFYNMSSGEGSNRVNAIALCRGDVNSGDCLSCVNSSTTELRNLCPNQKEAIIWYDNCMFRYTNRSVFGVMETGPSFYMWNNDNVTDVNTFNQVLSDLMGSLRSNASLGTSDRKFATGSAKVSAFQTVYALVQCTPDLTETDCNSCLGQAVQQIPQCCDKKQGGRVVGPSCNFRFEMYLFYTVTSAEILPPPPPPPPPPLSPPPSNHTRSTTGKKGNSSTTIIIITVSAVAFVLLLISCCIFFFSRVRKSKVKTEKTGFEETEAMDEIRTVESLQYDFRTISAATDNFSNAKKLGQGGFGTVYKGTLPDGKLIAVKRLSTDSGQGDQEFKNEVKLVAKLQHRNLVRLQGFCLEGNERLLIYEFVPNASLDQFLFEPNKRVCLHWERRYKIIGGIAKGLLYLHEDSRLRIIHRDLKASNVLLDAEMNPKISDFGMARLCTVDQTQGATSRIVGTYGYMAPEYAMHGQFSIKSDVFSFGILLLEVISGQKNSAFCYGENLEDLLSFAWRNWEDGTPLNLVDPTLRESSSRTEVMRCIHIALLCVQGNAAERPNMTTVVVMLTSYSVTLPLPSKPAFFMHSNIQSGITWLQDSESGTTESSQSKTNTATHSKNEVSITELYPR